MNHRCQSAQCYHLLYILTFLCSRHLMATNDFINGLYPKQKKTRNPTRFRALSLQNAKVNARQSMRVEPLPLRRTPAMQVLRPHAPNRNDKRALSMRAEYSHQGAHLPCSRCCVRTLHSATINARQSMRVEPLPPRRTPAMQQVLRPHAPFRNDKRAQSMRAAT